MSTVRKNAFFEQHVAARERKRRDDEEETREIREKRDVGVKGCFGGIRGYFFSSSK